MKRAFEKLLVEQCAPALAGIKPASLFRFAGAEGAAIRRLAAEWDRLLTPKGIRVTVLRECLQTGACMIYVYREKWLGRVLRDADNRAFLERMGYRTEEGLGMLEQLSRRFCLEREYPHEVGLFLGYPLEDVVGFIENRGGNYTCLGLWKSYGDPAAAEARFRRCRACTAAYRRRYEQGASVLALAVAA